MTEVLCERLNWSQASMRVDHVTDEKGEKRLFLEGICIQGEVRNHNNRIYPLAEVTRAVQQLNECIANGETIYGEADHPDELMKINLDRVSHIIESMRIEGTNGVGRLRVVPTPMGQICRTLVECGGRLGVSTRGIGDLHPVTGMVSNYQIVTVDIVARPSAPNAYPTPVYEGRQYYRPSSILDSRNGTRMYALAEASLYDPSAQKYLRKEVLDWIRRTLELEG